jgi:Tfp pilus assembly protein PilO
MPLMKELRKHYLECKSLEADVLDARNVITLVDKTYAERVLIKEKDISQAIDKLTRHGKLEGINFISINPKEIRKKADSRYKILPIEMEIESGYEQLGAFLGSLDDLEKGLIKVKSLYVVPNKEDPSRLMTDLVVDMYLLGQE